MNNSTHSILAPLTKRLSLQEFNNAVVDVHKKVDNDTELIADYYGRKSQLKDFRDEIMLLSQYLHETYNGHRVLIEWDSGNEDYDARLFENKSDRKPVKHIQLTLTENTRREVKLDRMTEQARRQRLTGEALDANLKQRLDEQTSQPDFLGKRDTGLYPLLPRIALAVIKKIAKGYNRKDVETDLVVGEVVHPLFDDIRDSHDRAKEKIAWSLSFLEHPFSDIYLVTGRDQSVVTVPRNVQTETENQRTMRKVLEFYPKPHEDALQNPFPRTEYSGAVNNSFEKFKFLLDEIAKSFFPAYQGEAAPTRTKYSVENVRHGEIYTPQLKFEIPRFDLRKKNIVDDPLPGFLFGFTPDFISVCAGFDCYDKIKQHCRDFIEAYIFRHYAQDVFNQKSETRELIIGSSFLLEFVPRGESRF